MAYTKIVFQNSPSTATPLNAENLNHMDDQIALNDQRLTEIETSYVKSFNGRKGEVVPESGDYNIGQISPLTGAQVGQVPVVVNHGTEEDPELVFEMGTGGGGGHSIIDSEGNTMPQESAMQFADSHVSDDSTNGRTVVENIKEVASADYSSETEDGMYLIPDGEGAVIEPASDDYVEVTADGVKTYAQLFAELWTKIDASKVTAGAFLSLDASNPYSAFYKLRSATASAVSFVKENANTNNPYVTIEMVYISANFNTLRISNPSSYSDADSNVKPSQGTVIVLYYGSKKATVDLQTTANRCWYDSENTVKQKLDGLATSGIWTHTVTATEAGSSVIYALPNNIKAGAKKLIPTGCIVGSQTKPCVYDNDNNLFIIFGMNTNDTVTIYYVAIM